MNRARKFGVPTPGIFLIDEVSRKIYMEHLGPETLSVKEFLYQLNSYDHPSNEEIPHQH